MTRQNLRAYIVLGFYIAVIFAFSNYQVTLMAYFSIPWWQQLLLWTGFCPLAFGIGAYLYHAIPVTFLASMLAILISALFIPVAFYPALTLLIVFFTGPVWMGLLP